MVKEEMDGVSLSDKTPQVEDRIYIKVSVFNALI